MYRKLISCLICIISLTSWYQVQADENTSTAAKNVQVLEQSFEMPGLNRNRKIRIYLPPDYNRTAKRYPVLYMHDGQNLFDRSTSYAGEWGIDETLNRLHKSHDLSMIVVGIDNGLNKRMNELSPWKNSKFGDPEGKQYMEFIVKVIKPYIDNQYRTKASKEFTGIMGSSMGGLISQYAIFRYPEIFSKAGIYSPSLWFSDQVYGFSDIKKLAENSKLYYLMGSKEGLDNVNNMQSMVSQLSKQGMPEAQLASYTIEGGEHNEKFWRGEFEKTVLWLFSKN